LSLTKYNKYLTDDYTLDYQLLYADMAEITGFNHKQNREALYKAVTDWYTEVKAQTPTGKGIRVTESDVVEIINKESNRTFELVEDEFSRYDAEDSDYIMEIKTRYTWYNEFLIEHDKMDVNIALAKAKNKEFLYVSAVDQGSFYSIYVFNCSKLVKKDHKFKWDWKELPTTTEFSNNNPKVKFVGYLSVDVASILYTGDKKCQNSGKEVGKDSKESTQN